MNKKIIFPLIALIVLISALLGVYIYVALNYRDRFYKGTVINGKDVSDLKVEEVKELFSEEAVSDFKLTLWAFDGEEIEIAPEDIGFNADYSGLSQIKEEQGHYNWVIANGKDKEYELKPLLSVSDDAMGSFIDGLSIMQEDKWEKPQDAKVVKDEEKGYIVIPETHGNVIIKDKLMSCISDAVNNGEPIVDLEEKGCYEKAGITSGSPEIRSVMDKIERFTNAVITYDLGEYSFDLDKETTNPWIDINENGEAYIKEELVREYVEELYKEYSTMYKTRLFTTSAGEEVEIEPGNYGYIVDKEGEFAEIIKDLEGGRPVKREMVYSYDGRTHDNHDIGDTYIEISITDQHLWYYEEGELVLDCDIRTGCINRGQGTPTGCYEVRTKYENIVLVGEDYRSPVDFWIGFYKNSIGMHDASWVSQFGGETYKWNGSHGCVNMPYESIKELFSRVELGVPVVVYWV